MREGMRQWRKAVVLFLEYVRDFKLYMKYNRFSPSADQQKKAFYKLIIESHSIEKGLSLSQPKLLFGKEKIRDIIRLLHIYDGSRSSFPEQMALGALEAYVKLHREAGASDRILEEIDAVLDENARRRPFELTGGVKDFAMPGQDETGLASLLSSRASCRMFDNRRIESEVLEEMVRLAQKAPSQCNRQSGKVHIYQNPGQVQKLLELQSGSRGFSQNVGTVLVVTSDLVAWSLPEQRNQAYVDGALWAMGLLLGAHSLGLLTCPLNLAVDNAKERNIKAVGNIDEDERLIMMIGIGYPKPGPLRVANSPRRALGEVCTVHPA